MRLVTNEDISYGSPVAVKMSSVVVIPILFILLVVIVGPYETIGSHHHTPLVKTMFESKLSPEKKATMVRTENGCPFPFDFGQLGGIWYAPHDICYNYRYPLYINPLNNHPVPTGDVEFDLDLFPGMSDTYKLTIRVVNATQTKFRLWDLVIWNEQAKTGLFKGNPSAGYFEVKEHFLPLCCDILKSSGQVRDTIKFTNTNNDRLTDTFVRWVPLDYKGWVVFKARVVSTPHDYIREAKSKEYEIPFPSTVKEEDLPYDEDWPEGSPFIPED